MKVEDAAVKHENSDMKMEDKSAVGTHHEQNGWVEGDGDKVKSEPGRDETSKGESKNEKGDTFFAPCADASSH